MYVSYRWTKTGKKTYICMMVFFVILVSFLSTFLGYAWILLSILYPLWLLSFPFLSSVEQLHSHQPVTGYNIQFITMEIVSIPPQNAVLYGFMFFLSVNLIGAILGYWIDKRFLTESFKRNLFDFFFRSGAISLLACYIIAILYNIILREITGYQVNHYLNDHTLWYTLGDTIHLFSIYFFWTPAAIATTVYGIYERFRRKE